MTDQSSGLFGKLSHRLAMRRWARAARLARQTDLATLRAQRALARRMRQHIDQLIHVADDRLRLPRIGSTAPRV